MTLPGSVTRQFVGGINSAYRAQTNIWTWHEPAIDSMTFNGTTYQVACYWNMQTQMVIGVRALPNGRWTNYAYDGTGGLPDIAVTDNDKHRVCNVGLDKNGYIHVAYDMKNQALNYRRSTLPVWQFAGALTGELEWTGDAWIDKIEYPIFFRDPSDEFYVWFRCDGTGNADWFFFHYIAETETWDQAAGTASDGKMIDGTSDTMNPYIWGMWPVFDSDFGSGGFMHIVWNWRGEDGSNIDSTNHDVCHMKWDGTNFYQMDGTPQTIPARLANSDIWDPTPTYHGLENKCALTIDSNDHPHAAYIKGDGDPGYAQVWHAWHNGSDWVILQLTDTPTDALPPDAVAITKLQYSRPRMAIDKGTDTVYIIYRDDADTQGILVLISDPGDFTTWRREVLWSQDVGYWEPTFDRQQWQDDKTMYIMLQYGFSE